MSCFPCFQSNNKDEDEIKGEDLPLAQPKDLPPSLQTNNVETNNNTASTAQDAPQAADAANNAAESDSGVNTFTFRELATATKNFRQECLLIEGGVGRIFKGTLSGSGQVVAVRQLDRNGVQDSKEFLREVGTLTELEHPNLVKMIGCCADGEQRLLVYEYMPASSLKGHLFDLAAGDQPLDWSKRMKIALGIAEGLEYLHEKVKPPIIYRDLKSSSILLDEVNNPKLAEYGLAKLVQSGSKMHGGFGYSAPEYERNGELTEKSDVYSFGVVLLELITGRKALDTDRPSEEQNLVSWAQPIFRDQSKFSEMADPLLRKGFPITSLNQAVGVAAMCLQDEPFARPLISDISAALSFLAMAPPEAPIPARLVSILSTKVDTAAQFGDCESVRKSKSSSGNTNSDTSDDDDNGDDDGGDNDIKAYNSDGDKSCSDYEYGDSSSDNYSDGNSEINPEVLKSGKSRKLNSSSKCRSKKKSSSSSISSKISSKSSKSSCSLRSSPSSMGFSLRCDSSFPERDNESDDISSVGSDREQINLDHNVNHLSTTSGKRSHSRSKSSRKSSSKGRQES